MTQSTEIIAAAWGVARLLWWWLGPPLIWVLAIQLFPKLLGEVFLKSVEHRHNIKIEEMKAALTRENSILVDRFKANIEAAYSTLTSSVDFIAASQKDARVKMIDSVERLWSILLNLSKDFAPVIFIDTILLATEIDGGLRGGKGQSFVETLEPFRQQEAVFAKFENAGANDADKHRVFVSNKLWIVFFIMRALYGRAAMLITLSLKEQQYHDWRSDKVLGDLLANVLSADIVQGARQQPSQGLQVLIWQLEGQFLAEAAAIMSGVRSLADNLSEMQAALILEKEKIAAEVERPLPPNSTNPLAST
jgi:hypothetical protein